jgi:general nucleoside transport system permease protein
MKKYWPQLTPWIGLFFGLLISCLLALLFKENPWHVFKVLTTSMFNSKFDFGLTLFYTTCLIFSGLAFSIPLKAGLFHIGAEGQILFSAFTAAFVGATLSLNLFTSLVLVFVFTALAGISSALVIALLKIYRNAHEVVVAIMLNFIFAALTTWMTINLIQNPDSQNPESALIHEPLRFMQNDFLKVYFDQSAVSSFFIVAVISCLILYFLESNTLIGSQIKAFGLNPQAAQRLGISKVKIICLAMGLAGLCSSGVALTEVLGNSFQYKIGFSPQYGFLGIAVALLARQNSIGIIFSAFLMACLHKGASDLDLETQFLTRDFSNVLQALIIFSVAASYFIFDFLSRRQKRTEGLK